MGLVKSTENTIGFWVGFISFKALKLKSLDFIFEFFNVLVEFVFFVFVVFESVSEEFLMVGFLLIAISDKIFELSVVGLNGSLKRAQSLFEFANE
jgi:hypothetical protein